MRKIIDREIADKFNISIEEAEKQYWNKKFYENGKVIYIDNKKLYLSADAVKEIKEIPVTNSQKSNFNDLLIKLADVRCSIFQYVRNIKDNEDIYDKKSLHYPQKLRDNIEFLIQSMNEINEKMKTPNKIKQLRNKKRDS